jgi:hypothetical protein
MEFRFRAHHATAATLSIRLKSGVTRFGGTIEVFYPADRQQNSYLYYSIVFINLLKIVGISVEIFHESTALLSRQNKGFWR